MAVAGATETRRRRVADVMPRWRTAITRTMLVFGVTVSATLAACGSNDVTVSSQTMANLQRQADIYAISQIEVNWHKAASTKDLDLIVSLFSKNATVIVGPQTYVGQDQIRHFFATQAASFQPQNVWVSETPAYKIRITVNGDTGTLYFECHYVDVATRQIKSVVAADDTVSRINGRWLITRSLTGTAILSP